MNNEIFIENRACQAATVDKNNQIFEIQIKLSATALSKCMTIEIFI